MKSNLVKLAEATHGWTDNERIAFLLEAAREFGRTLDKQKIYTSLQRMLAGAMPLDGLIVSSFDSESKLIHCEFVWSDGRVVDCGAFPPIPWNPSGSGMQGHVILTAKAEKFDIETKVHDPNTSYVQTTADGSPSPVQDKPAAKSALMAPMILDGGVTGVIQAMSDLPSAYTEDHLGILEDIALLMTPAWNNARTYERAGQERRLTDRILETSPDVVYVFDLRTLKIVFHNRQMQDLLGYDEKDVAAMEASTLPEAMHPEDAALLPALLARYTTARDQDLLEAEWRVKDKQGEYHWFLNRARVFERDDDGRPVQILGHATDVTERKRMEAEKHEADERYRFLAESGPYIVFTTDGDGVIDYANARWKDYFGTDPQEISATVRAELVHEDDRTAVHAAWAHARERAEPLSIEYRLRRVDGEHRWHLCRAIPIKDAHGEVARWFGVIVDIHAQKETEAELEARVQERTSELKAAVDELEGFTYSVSHDLRGPLRAISAASMILREDYSDALPADARHYLLRQAEAAKKMGTLIDELLKLSRIGRQELSLEAVDLSSMAKELVGELKGVKRNFSVEEDLSATGDPRLLRFVLQNLIDNAVKFSPEGSTISVGRWKKAFFVKDEGIGFEMEYQDKLFRPFERLVREEDYPGTGIGLANVHRIISRHKGKVWAESEPGHGSTFYFTLPSRS